MSEQEPSRGRRPSQNNNKNNRRKGTVHSRDRRKPNRNPRRRSDDQDDSTNGPSPRNKPHPSQNNNNNNKNKARPPRTESRASSDKASSNVPPYPPHLDYAVCMERYMAAGDYVVRGKLRVLPSTTNTGASFVSCDRGNFDSDIVIADAEARNRAMDGDTVFVELIRERHNHHVAQARNRNGDTKEARDEGGDEIMGDWQKDDPSVLENKGETKKTWQDDEAQMDLWNPIVSVPRPEPRLTGSEEERKPSAAAKREQQQRGVVVHVLPPAAVTSELDPTHMGPKSKVRTILGHLKVLQSGTTLLTPTNRSLPQFKCPPSFAERMARENGNQKGGDNDAQTAMDRTIYRADYEYGSWLENHKWPPCRNVRRMGTAGILEDEIQALLTENEVDHGEFESDVLKSVQQAVESGIYHDAETGEMGWKPTPSMYRGRHDYRKERIFTIDPSTAKDLDDALHIKYLEEENVVEVGVHIADVSHFVQPDTPVDREAQRRATTVYLVDRTVPMLPRPLCEIACSLNENVERLAFSCVWKMNLDGTLRTKGKGKKEEVWYGRTVIKSCARLDYATAQNIIDGKVAAGDDVDSVVSEELWPKSRRPTGGHSLSQVAADVRLMHKVAMARRRLRFDNGALALNGIKLTFKLDSDGQTPLFLAPYPIRDSNRLVEEYMLLANYLVAQRLITHARDLALLRHHPEPLEDGLDQVAVVAKAGIGFDVDISSSKALHSSLSRLGHECDDPLVIQSVTQMLMTPMCPADYFVAGLTDPEGWRHFALNIPYYTHFTSPIRRYPDVIVHRLLQATIDGEEAVEKYPQKPQEIDKLCQHSNEKRMASKTAQERCDRVFLALYVKAHPLTSELGVVLSVGVSTFTVFVPSIGVGALLYLDEHKDFVDFESRQAEDGTRSIVLRQKDESNYDGPHWGVLEITVFQKLAVTVYCREKPPIDVKLKLEGPWRD